MFNAQPTGTVISRSSSCCSRSSGGGGSGCSDSGGDGGVVVTVATMVVATAETLTLHLVCLFVNTCWVIFQFRDIDTAPCLLVW